MLESHKSSSLFKVHDCLFLCVRVKVNYLAQYTELWCVHSKHSLDWKIVFILGVVVGL